MDSSVSRISVDVLASLLRLNHMTLRKWHRQGILTGTSHGNFTNGPLWLDVSSVNSLLARGMLHYPAITVHDLLTQRVTLVRQSDVRDSFEFTKEQTGAMFANGKRPAVMLGDHAKRLLATYPPLPVQRKLTVAETALILGVGHARVHDLLKSRELTPTDEVPYQVDYDSLVALLRTRLPDWIDPHDWIQERLESFEPLLELRATQVLLGGKKYAAHFFERQLLRYIGSGSTMRPVTGIAPESIKACIDSDDPVTLPMLALLYDESLGRVATWKADGKLTCAAHKPHAILKKACVLVILRQNLGSELRQLDWFDTQITKRRKLVGSVQAAEYLGIALDTTNALAAIGELQGLRTPAGTWKFTHHQLKCAKTRFKKQAAAAGDA
ncbi:MAG TPA: hypothetical protein VFO38_02780 [Candidatus Saccharimonadales bacterium]|nr:hypothetical protein [Candidatus Saccharimonadales bacterium]